MLNTLFGWHAAKELNVRFITITFEQSLAAGESTSFALADAVDGAALKTALEADDFLITGAICHANPGFVQLNVLPDNEALKKFRLEASNAPSFIPISPPQHASTDIVIDCVNENQPNDLFVTLYAIRINQSNLPAFTLLAESIPASLSRIDTELLNVRKILENIYTSQQGDAPPWTVPKPTTGPEKSRSFCKRGN